MSAASLNAAHYAKVTIAFAGEMFTEIGPGVRALVGQKLIEVGSARIGGGSINIHALRSGLENMKDTGKEPLVNG